MISIQQLIKVHHATEFRTILLVLGQNGSGQNDTDKMVWTKCYTDKMLIDKLVRTNWYGQMGTYKKVRTKCCADKMLQSNDWCTKIWDKLRRIIHRKVTLNKLKSIIVKRNRDFYSTITTIELALPSIYLVNKPRSGFELGQPESKS